MTDQEHLKKESFAERSIDKLSSVFHFSGPEIVYMLFLVALLIFFTTIAFVSVEVSAELDPSFKIPKEVVQHYGFPFDNLRWIQSNPHNITVSGGRMSLEWRNVTVYDLNSEITGSGLFMNFMIYSVLSFIIVKTYVKIKEEISYYKYDKG